MYGYEEFKALLDEQELFYRPDTLKDGTEIVRIPQTLDSGGVIEVVLGFNDDHVKLIVMKIANFKDDEKRLEVCELFNRLNRMYKFFKFSVDEDGDVVFEGDLVTDLRDGDFQPDTLMAYVAVALKMLKQAYPQIMKIMWA